MSITSSTGGRNDGPVLFWARRSPVIGWRGVILTGLLLGPLAFLAPGSYVVALSLGALFAAIGTRAFRFEITARALRLKVSLFLPAVRIALADVAGADAQPDVGSWALSAEDDIGVLMIRLRDGRLLPVAGIVGPREAADAVNRLAAAARQPGARAVARRASAAD
jgi:hypothetical protein